MSEFAGYDAEVPRSTVDLIRFLEPDAAFEWAPARQIFVESALPAPEWLGYRWWEGEALDEEAVS